jgi:hypothetical protein
VELELQAGRWRQRDVSLTDEEIERAFDRFARGKSDFY